MRRKRLTVMVDAGLASAVKRHSGKALGAWLDDAIRLKLEKTSRRQSAN